MKRYFYNYFYNSSSIKIFLNLICGLICATCGLANSIIWQNKKGIIAFIVLIVLGVTVTIVRVILSSKNDNTGDGSV